MVNTIFNWAIAAIVASFTIMPVSINRQTVPTVEPVTEAELKGCATNFDDEKVLFLYDKSKGFSEAAVTDPDNWNQSAPGLTSCLDINEVACAIRVSPEFVDTSTQGLKSIINLVASESANNLHFVSDSDDGEMEIINNQEPLN